MSEAKAADGAKPAEKKKAKPASDILSDKKSTKAPWTLERCQKAAKRFQNEAEWASGAPASYKSAVAHGWTSQCMKNAGKVHKKSA